MLKHIVSYQDAEIVANDLYEASAGAIKTGVYHAQVPDADKENLHARWRKGTIKVVCATIGKHATCYLLSHAHHAT